MSGCSLLGQMIDQFTTSVFSNLNEISARYIMVLVTLCPCGTHRHHTRMVALTELAICTVMIFFLAMWDSGSSLLGMKSRLQVNVMVILSELVEARRIVDPDRFMEIIRNPNF